jgi:hypothetical protein
MGIYILLDGQAEIIHSFEAADYTEAMQIAETYRKSRCIFRAVLFALVHNGRLGA